MAHAATPKSLPGEELNALHAGFCQGLRDPKRLLIVAALRDVENSVGDLCQLIGARQCAASQHLALIRCLALVQTHRAEGNVLYRPADQRRAEAVMLPRAIQADLQRQRSDPLGIVFEQE